jgi:hypothetical protein
MAVNAISFFVFNLAAEPGEIPKPTPEWPPTEPSPLPPMPDPGPTPLPVNSLHFDFYSHMLN